MSESKPIRLTRARAEALLDVFEKGVVAETAAIKSVLQFSAILSADEAERLRQRDLRLAAAKDAAAIVRHRYAGGVEPIEPAIPLF